MTRLFSSASIARTLGFSLSLCVGLHLFAPATVKAQSNSYNMGSGSQTAPKGALGLVINWNQQRLLVVTKVVPGGPAANAGIAVGDQLLAIDGQNINGLPPAQIFSKIVGAVGTTSVLNLSSPNRGNYEAKITRVPVGSFNKSAGFSIGMQPADAGSSGNSTNSSTMNRSRGGSSAYGNTGTSSNFNTNSVADSNTNINNTSSNNYSGTTAGGVNWKVSGGGEAGYKIRYPNGWTAKQNAKTGRIEVKSPGGSELSIFPFFLPNQSINGTQAQGLFQLMLKKYAPGPQWSAPSSGPGGLRAMSTSDNINSLAGLVLGNMNGGTAGRLIVFKVPQNSNAPSELATMTQVLNTFTITGGAMQNSGGGGQNQVNSGANYQSGGAPASGGGNNAYVEMPYQNVQFTKFVDPNFSAFSLDVPVGWKVTGAMDKPMPVDLRPWVTATSPDQKILIFIGDNRIMPRYLPAQWLNFLGCPPGSIYKKSTGLVTRVLYYQTADKFLKKYVKSRLGGKCEKLELVDMQHHPELNSFFNGNSPGDVASATYNYSVKGDDGQAFFIGATKKGTQMWWVSGIAGVAAAKGYGPQAHRIFMRMYNSWQNNPQFLSAQGTINKQHVQNWIAYDRAARARSAAAFQARMAAMDARHEAFRSRMAAMDASHARYMNNMRASDRAHSNFINFIRDEDTLMNPETGTKYQVEYGPKYHWVNSTGDTVIGTDSAWRPGADYTELVAPPR